MEQIALIDQHPGTLAPNRTSTEFRSNIDHQVGVTMSDSGRAKKRAAMKKIDFWKFYFPFELGLMQGGVAWRPKETRVYHKPRYRQCWWLDKTDKHTCLCGIKLSDHASGIVNVSALADTALYGTRHGLLFAGNALAGWGFHELAFTREEVEREAVAKELGFMLAKLVRGEAHRMETVTWDGELGRCYPFYAWTTEAAARNAARNVRPDVQSSVHTTVEGEGEGNG